jgi:hypothetical protein
MIVIIIIVIFLSKYHWFLQRKIRFFSKSYKELFDDSGLGMSMAIN